jgi:anti-sigma regulatory factor (Ser/Thr protein kinase)
MGADTLELKLQNRLSELRRLSRHLQDFGERHGLPPRCVFEINFALEEILSNIISYSFCDDQEHWITVRLRLEGDTLTIRVKDDGRHFNLSQVQPPEIHCPLEKRAIGGLGIFFIRKFMDRIVYERRRETNVLTLKKQIRR